jgi:hypothetical protein
VVREHGAPTQSVHASHDGYQRLADPVTHHRRVTLDGKDGVALLVEDWLECKQAHDVELFWHAAPGATLTRVEHRTWRLDAGTQPVWLTVEGPDVKAAVVIGRESPPQGWVSCRFYERSPAPVLTACVRLSPGQVLRTVIRRGAP